MLAIGSEKFGRCVEDVCISVEFKNGDVLL